MVEVEIIRPIWHDGHPAKAGAVIQLGVAEAAYVVGLGRAVYVAECAEAGAPAADDKPEAKPRKRSVKGAA